MIFGVAVVGPMPDQFGWEGYFGVDTVCSSGIETFRVRNIIFAMLPLEIAPDNAAIDGFSLEYN